MIAFQAIASGSIPDLRKGPIVDGPTRAKPLDQGFRPHPRLTQW